MPRPDPLGFERGTKLGGIQMKVLSFRAKAIEHYVRAQQTQAMVKKKIKDGQWVRGKVARIDHMPGAICIVYLTVEEFEGGLEADRLPPGFYYGPLPVVTIGDPSNQRMEFTVNEDAIRYYPVGRSIRVDSNIDSVGKIEGLITKTCREPNALRPYWRVTVEFPAPAPAFEHYAIREKDTLALNYESSASYDEFRNFYGRDCYIKPSLKSVSFRVPERYMPGFLALFQRKMKVCIRLEDNSQDVTGYVTKVGAGTVEVHVTNVEQTRDWKKIDPELWKQVDARMDRVYGIKRSAEMSFALNFKDKETTMKIYEALVVKVDEKNQPVEVVAVIPPFVAANDQAAKDRVLVDYAQEKGLAGKDLTGFTVVVRNFQNNY